MESSSKPKAESSILSGGIYITNWNFFVISTHLDYPVVFRYIFLNRSGKIPLKNRKKRDKFVLERYTMNIDSYFS